MNRIWMIVLLCTVLQVTASAVPEYINYQARIFDATGAPMQGTYAVSFAIFDATREGNLVWGPFSCDGLPGEGHADTVVVWDGWFNVILGPKDEAGRLITLAFKPLDGKPRFIEITVDGEVISPRQQFLTAPYAARADHALHGVPPGCILAYYGTSAPAGWLLCDGSPIPEGEEYDALRAILQSDYTPDLRGRMILGVDGEANRVGQSQADTIGDATGEDYHQLTIEQMPKHSHIEEHPVVALNTYGSPDGGDNYSWTGYKYWNQYFDHMQQSVIRFVERGGVQSHNNMPPYMTLNWIIKY